MSLNEGSSGSEFLSFPLDFPLRPCLLLFLLLTDGESPAIDGQLLSPLTKAASALSLSIIH